MKKQVLLSLAAAILVAGCATLHPQADARPSSNPLMMDEANSSAAPYPPTTEAASTAVLEPKGASTVSHRSTRAEDLIPSLAEALSQVKKAPTADNQRLAGDRYREMGILDQAHQEYAQATGLNPTDAASWDALARIWRDWGFPQLGLPDAQRAVYHAADSAPAHNTLGTILHATGQRSLARREFARSLELDPTAAYAWNNLCYSWLLEGQADRASAVCHRALAVAPGLTAARNNLALTHAVEGDMIAAGNVFADGDEPGYTDYKLGILYMAQRRYAEAAAAFDRAAALVPALPNASARARQAHAMVAKSPGGGN